MTAFIGHTEAKLDAKGRLLFPSAFKKQLKEDASGVFVVKKDIYEDCLVMYPISEWEKQVEDLQSRLNPYNKAHNAFLRKFFSDTAEVSLDANNRLLLPKRLLEKVGIDKEVALIGVGNKIEIWDVEKFEQSGMDDSEFADFAQEILGNQEGGQ